MDELKIKPREYQSKILETCMKENCLVVLPKGTGKTLISVMLAIDQFKKNPLQKIYIVSDGVAYSTFQIHQMILAALGKRKVELYLPLFIWNGLAKIGDILQKIIHRRLPMSSVVFKKLFSNAAYCSQYAKNELQFDPQFTLPDVLPLIIKEYGF